MPKRKNQSRIQQLAAARVARFESLHNERAASRSPSTSRSPSPTFFEVCCPSASEGEEENEESPQPSTSRLRSVYGESAQQSTSREGATRSETSEETDRRSAFHRRSRRIERQVTSDRPEGSEQVWTLMHIQQMCHLIEDLLCPLCFASKLTVTIDESRNKGFASRMQLRCQNDGCSFATSQMSSPRLSGIARKNEPFEINQAMTVFSHEVGTGYSTLEKFSTVLGIPAMHLKAFQVHDKRLSAAEIQSGQEALQRAATAIRDAYADTDPDVAEALARGEQPVIDIGVSFDGTWQKRGFTSKFGVGVCIDILTGLVVDYEVMSTYCHACQMQEGKDQPLEDLYDWHVVHRQECCINHSGSSKAMERAAAQIMWGHSIEKYNFRFVQMLADGDSSAYMDVIQMAPYGDTPIEKLECINHAQKRLGTALRKLAKEHRLGGRGVGKLTEKKCDLLQTYYRNAVVENLDNLDKMRSSIWAAFHHSTATDSNNHHDDCPTTWCVFKQAMAAGKEPPSHTEHSSKTFLNAETASKVKAVYDRMTSDALLARMRHGRTQNANEALNSLIWLRCPKETFLSKSRVEGGVARAVISYNEGASGLLNVLRKMQLHIYHFTVQQLEKSDEKRDVKAVAAASAEERRRHRSQAHASRREQAAAEGEVYGAGMA